MCRNSFDGIEHLDLGRTCYTNNPFLRELLVALGYDADLLGADMDSPNVRTSVRIRVDSVAYHVDVRYAAPLRQPRRLDFFRPIILDSYVRGSIPHLTLGRVSLDFSRKKRDESHKT